jgi:hypothetical protein
MRLSVAITCSLVLLAALLLGACPRQYSAGNTPPQAGTATHPWELQGWKPPVDIPQQDGQDATAQVELPPDIGPQLPAQDLLNPGKLPGLWLQVCHVFSERMNLVKPDDMDEMELQDGGAVVYRAVSAGRAVASEGAWEKTKPGRLRIHVAGGRDTEYYAVLYRNEFLYIWDQDKREADWFVKVPLLPSDSIKANDFSTTLGELKFTSVVGNSCEGTLTGKNVNIRVTGFFVSGILALRWEDPQRNGAGYSAFHVDQDWNSLYGALWLGDFEAAPFLGPWDGTRAQDAAGAPANPGNAAP